jgi:ATP-binding cassette subfamily C protein
MKLRQHLSVGSAGVLAVIVYLSYTVLAVSTGQLLLLLFLFARLVPRLIGMYAKAQSLASMLPAYTRVVTLEQHCVAAAETVPARDAEITLATRIDLERVTFDYQDDGRAPALRDISLRFAAGATTAVVAAAHRP